MRMAGAVFLLLLLGSYVSGRDAGYVFPDWPLMNGKLIPNLDVQVQAIHFLHRGYAAIVGVVLVMFVIGMSRRKAEFPLAARLAHVAAGLFAVEVLIGALNVWTKLNSIAVTFHLLIGALIWGSLVGAAVVTSPALERVASSRRVGTSRATVEQGA
jgi:heme A synthase